MSLLDPTDDEQLDAMIAALEAERLARIKSLEEEVARLRLTDAERTEIRRLIEDYEQDGEPASQRCVDTLRGLLERTK